MYSLYVTSYRLTRRRILGLVNYMHVTMHCVERLYALVTRPRHAAQARPGDWAGSGGGEPGVDDRDVAELARWRHTFAADGDGVLQCWNQDRVAVVYEEALEGLGQVQEP